MIYAVIDTNVIVSALLTHNPMVATAKVLDFLSEDSFLVTGNLKHFPATPKVISPADMVAIIENEPY